MKSILLFQATNEIIAHEIKPMLALSNAKIFKKSLIQYESPNKQSLLIKIIDKKYRVENLAKKVHLHLINLEQMDITHYTLPINSTTSDQIIDLLKTHDFDRSILSIIVSDNSWYSKIMSKLIRYFQKIKTLIFV